MKYDQTRSRGQWVTRYGRPFTSAARLACGLGAVVLAGNVAAGQTWTGAGADDNWSTGPNWTGGFIPVNNGTAALIFAGSTRPTPNTDMAWGVNSIEFAADAGGFNLGGGAITITSGGAITNNSMATQGINNALVLTGPVTVGGAGATNLFGVVSGPGGITKDGAGNLALRGANTFTGPVTLNAGNLVLGNDAALGGTTSLTINGGNLSAFGAARTIGEDVAVTVNGNFGVIGDQNLTITSDIGLTATRTVNVATTGTALVSLSGDLSGAGGLTKTGAGRLQLSGNNTFTGPVTATAGRLVLGSDTALGATTSLTLGGDVKLEAAGANRLISSGVAVTVTGNFGAVGSQDLTIASDLELTATRTIDVVMSTANTFTLSGDITGTGGMNKTGTGRLRLTGDNSFSGPVTLSAGTLSLGSNTALGTTTAMTIAGGTLEAFGGARTIGAGVGVSVTGDFTVAGSNNLTIASNIALTGSRTVTVTNTGVTEISGVISGAGARLTKLGSSGLILSGVNTYTGETVAGAGTLTIASTGSTVGDARVEGGILAIDGRVNGNVTVSSGILALGADNAVGGDIILSGGNMEARGVSAGATREIANNLVINGNFSITGTQALDLAGNTVLNADREITVSNTGGTTFSGVISGAGGLTKRGSGGLALSGVNTFAGELVVNQGTLTIAGSAGEGEPAGSIANDARVNGGSLVVNGLVEGDTFVESGSLTVNGQVGGGLAVSGGTATLSAANAAAQDATVSGGALVLNADNAVTGDVTLTGGTLAFGVDDGVGGDIIVSGGSLQALGEVEEGQTRTIAKALVINNNFAIGGSQDIEFSGNTALNADRVVTVDNSGQTIFSGVLSGPGGFTKAGAGDLFFNGANTYTGQTVVTRGMLTIAEAGAVAGGARVEAGGILMIQGRVEGNTLVNGTNTLAGILGGSGTIGGDLTLGLGSQLQSRLDPTGSFLATQASRLGVDGDLTMEDGSTMFVLIASSTDASRVDVGGMASLDGRLVAEVASGVEYTPRRNDRFEIITAGGGIEGAFDSVQSLTASLGVGFEIEGSSVFMTVVDIPFVNSAVTENQIVMANLLETFRTGPNDLTDFIEDLEQVTTDEGVRAVLDQMVPDEGGALSQVSFATMQTHAQDLSTRLAEHRVGYVPAVTGPSVNNLRMNYVQFASAGQNPQEDLMLLVLAQQGSPWEAPGEYGPPKQDDKLFETFVAGAATFGDVEAGAGGSGYDFLTGQVTLGLDRKFGQNAVGGFLLGYDRSEINVGADGGGSDVTSARFGVYGSMYGRMYRRVVFVNAYVGGAYHFYEIDRNVQMGATTLTATAEPEGLELDAMGEFGFEIPIEKTRWSVYPVVTVIYNDLTIDDYSESGGGAINLMVGEQNARSFLVRPGARISGNYKAGSMRLLPEIRVAYQHDFHDSVREETAQLAVGGGTFTYRTADLGEDSALVGVGLTVVAPGGWAVYGNYNAELGRSDYLAQNFQLGFQLRF